MLLLYKLFRRLSSKKLSPKYNSLRLCVLNITYSFSLKYFSNIDNLSSAAASLLSSSITASCDALRHRIYDISYQNTTELNSTIHFCRIKYNDFNYSSNPTYLTGSKIRVKNTETDQPVSYFTTVGLYSSDNELLAVGKLSEPIKKTPSNDMTVRVRLDY